MSSAPRLTPSSLNWTPVTPTLSAALAETATEEPLTVEPADGAVSETDGALVSVDGAGAAPPQRFAARFHLHPSVKAARGADRKSVLLTLPSGASWRFSADAEIDLADGVYLGSGDAIRKTQQLVIAGVTGSEPTTIKWALKKATGIEADGAV